MIESYHFDDMLGEDRSTGTIPVRMRENFGDWKEGFLSLSEHDFRSKSGCAYDSGNGTVTLIVHSNCSYVLREVKGGV